ncbi:MAG: low molecular weight protein-tyrosine-phosphatase [Candidatus Limnocylindrus sp.]
MISVLLLCHGNICRSPLAEVLLEAAIAADAVLAGRVRVSSAGTSSEHEGEGMHEHSAALLRQRGLRTTHRARELTLALADEQDLILAADRWNLRDAKGLVASGHRRAEVRLIRDFDPTASGRDLDDPWSQPISAYERTAQEIERAIPGILEALRTR